MIIHFQHVWDSKMLPLDVVLTAKANNQALEGVGQPTKALPCGKISGNVLGCEAALFLANIP